MPNSLPLAALETCCLSYFKGILPGVRPVQLSLCHSLLGFQVPALFRANTCSESSRAFVQIWISYPLAQTGMSWIGARIKEMGVFVLLQFIFDCTCSGFSATGRKISHGSGSSAYTCFLNLLLCLRRDLCFSVCVL